MKKIKNTLKKIIALIKFIFVGKSLQKPVVIQFPVNDICNSRCQMCRIWENKKEYEVSLEKLRSGLRNDLFSEVQTVGLNGGEPTLRKDLGQITKVLFEELPKLNQIALITNGYKFKEVIERTDEIGKIVKDNNGTFNMMVSLDGYGAVHDAVRGKPGNFDRAEKVIDHCLKSEYVDVLRIGCTIIKENVYGMHDLFDYCKKKGVYIKYRLGIPHKRLYSDKLTEPYALNYSEKVHIAEFLNHLINNYESDILQRYFYSSLRDQLLFDTKRKAGCNWQHRGATINSKGELLYCAVESEVIGDLEKDDSMKVYFNQKNHLQNIIKEKCDDCNHDYTGFPDRKELPTMLLNEISIKLKRFIKKNNDRWFGNLAINVSYSFLRLKHRFHRLFSK